MMIPSRSLTNALKVSFFATICNYFYCDEPEKAVEYMKMGVDTLLTNNCLAIARAFERAGIL